ncbi:hypothetical protein H4582DRAFT_2083048 [Lactarius indigo]|nr:hypothetical protein H4582DRAFT_2083048 [Lactarius indigo]
MAIQPVQAASPLAPNAGPKSPPMANGPIGDESDWEDKSSTTDGFSSASSSQHGNSTNGDSTGNEADHTGDPVDTTDANVFEIISRDNNFNPLVTPEPVPVSGSPCLSPPPEDVQPSIPDACNPDTRPISFVDHFPHELNSLIDKALPGHPSFRCEDLVIGGEDLQFHYHDVVLCIRTLFGNPEFAHELVFAPERHYADAE